MMTNKNKRVLVALLFVNRNENQTINKSKAFVTFVILQVKTIPANIVGPRMGPKMCGMKVIAPMYVQLLFQVIASNIFDVIVRMSSKL